MTPLWAAQAGHRSCWHRRTRAHAHAHGHSHAACTRGKRITKSTKPCCGTISYLGAQDMCALEYTSHKTNNGCIHDKRDLGARDMPSGVAGRHKQPHATKTQCTRGKSRQACHCQIGRDAGNKPTHARTQANGLLGRGATDPTPTLCTGAAASPRVRGHGCEHTARAAATSAPRPRG
jgi:hypothetical protein